MLSDEYAIIRSARTRRSGRVARLNITCYHIDSRFRRQSVERGRVDSTVDEVTTVQVEDAIFLVNPVAQSNRGPRYSTRRSLDLRPSALVSPEVRMQVPYIGMLPSRMAVVAGKITATLKGKYSAAEVAPYRGKG